MAKLKRYAIMICPRRVGLVGAVDLLISSAKYDCLLIQQIDDTPRFSDSLNLECVVLPLGNNVAAMLDVAFTNTISPILLTYAMVARYKKVFLVTPRPSIKNTTLSLRSIALMIVSNACC